ncbi:GNAT family N-acetyltransferase [Fimbriimonas ginsengisoli]|uniref:GCN5-related N-acetyltransferase n=1 Tax=Fimbriimonas ginsengisoli Gsoil 348 TaxID=661478 RepID=A0A068NM02_FIMGI|nr:GNAT family N-acetyltransferase [Fimbriimonas ginsengisoli]AIE84553.1 GCN5-related N-acetyltransferase [Fimbriimonas ginsengisoli Gsoil 348]
MDVTTKRTDSGDPGFQSLVERLTRFLSVLNGENDAFYTQHNKTDNLPTVVVAYAGAEPVGCGAFRWVRDGVVEIKRMYVDPDHRGRGVGAQVLRELEAWAAEAGASTAILETSKRLQSAVRLYQRSGYRVIENYGPYVGVHDSVCMEKIL